IDAGPGEGQRGTALTAARGGGLCGGRKRSPGRDAVSTAPMPAGTAAFSLAGQSALVIGGGSGIGRAIAIGLAGAGAKVSVAGRRKDWLEEAIGTIGTKGAAGKPYPLDAREPRALAALLAQWQKDGGPPDIVVKDRKSTRLNSSHGY